VQQIEGVALSHIRHSVEGLFSDEEYRSDFGRWTAKEIGNWDKATADKI